jgi:uncharacterized membrane protein
MIRLFQHPTRTSKFIIGLIAESLTVFYAWIRPTLEDSAGFIFALHEMDEGKEDD